MMQKQHHSSSNQQARKGAAEEDDDDGIEHILKRLLLKPTGGAAAAAAARPTSSITTPIASRATGTSMTTRNRNEKSPLISKVLVIAFFFLNLSWFPRLAVLRTDFFEEGQQQVMSQPSSTTTAIDFATKNSNTKYKATTIIPIPKSNWNPPTNKSRPAATAVSAAPRGESNNNVDKVVVMIEDKQEQKQNEPKKTKALPYLVMFVGPGKTATTTLQSALTVLEQRKILAKDNYVYLGRRRLSTPATSTNKKGNNNNNNKKTNKPLDMPIWSPMVEAMVPAHRRTNPYPSLNNNNNNNNNKDTDCGRNYTACWTQYAAQDVIDDLSLKQQRNAIVYEEYLCLSRYDIHALQQSIKGKFQLIIVVGYRRLFSWLPSWKNQMEKKFDSDWPEKQRQRSEAATDSMRELALNRKRATRAPLFFKAAAYSPAESHDGWTVDVLRRYQSWNAHSNIRIFNMHYREGDVISHFLCDILPHSKHSCAAASLAADALETTEENPSVNMDFSLIAVEAMDRDLLDPNKVARQEAVTYIRGECFEKNKKALFPLPMECLDLESEQVLLNKSLRIERELVANFSDTSPHLKEFWTRDEEKRHRQSFRKSTAKFCSVNLTAIFAHPLWLGCLAEINKKATKIISTK